MAAQLIHQMMNKVFWEQRYRFCVILVLDILRQLVSKTSKTVLILIFWKDFDSVNYFYKEKFLTLWIHCFSYMTFCCIWESLSCLLYWYIQWKSWVNKATATKAKYKPNQNAEDNTNQSEAYNYHCCLPSNAFPFSSPKHLNCLFFEETY